MNTAWVLIFILALGVLFFNRASLVVFAIGYAVLLLIANLLAPPSLTLLAVLWLVFIIVLLPLCIAPLRRYGFSRPVLRFFRQSMPSMSTTEREALSAGDVVWVKELFSGRPNWETLANYRINEFSEDDRAFLEGPVQQLCTMINEWEQTRQHWIPDTIWDYLKKERFFSLIIPKEYGGRQLSATAISATLMTVAGLCRDIASCIAVPNSLGPGELLLHYGTDEQKSYYLPRLASGQEIPCFALTSPVAGSDAGAIQDHGVVCRAVFEGKEQLCIRLNWNKRYITLAPVATLLGLAFKLYDPEHLLGLEEAIGITCALIPVTTTGVTIGRRHLPLNASFPNGPTQGEDVIIPIDWVIGGRQGCGQGWKMLMECLAAGRSISLPSIGIGVAKLGALTSSAYAQIRHQFNTPIGLFGGIQERLTEITGLTYLMNATELMTTGIIDGGSHPVVASGIVKSYITELSRVVLNHSMDVHAGKGICMGPSNYLGSAYMAAPISITVEGANILTRSMIIFGQGLIRAHPYVLSEMQAAEEKDASQALRWFDKAFISHCGFVLSNTVRSFVLGLTGGRGARAPVGPLKRYYQQLTRFSSVLAFGSDMAMIALGASLKRNEHLSGRFSDLLAYLYMGSAVLKFYSSRVDAERSEQERQVVDWSMTYLLYHCQQSWRALVDNMPSRGLRGFLRAVTLPLGARLQLPSDRLSKTVAGALMQPGAFREMMKSATPTVDHERNIFHEIEQVFLQAIEIAPVEKKLMTAVKLGQVGGLCFDQWLASALEVGVLTSKEHDDLQSVMALKMQIINVDDFAQNEV